MLGMTGSLRSQRRKKKEKRIMVVAKRCFAFIKILNVELGMLNYGRALPVPDCKDSSTLGMTGKAKPCKEERRKKKE